MITRRDETTRRGRLGADTSLRGTLLQDYLQKYQKVRPKTVNAAGGETWTTTQTIIPLSYVGWTTTVQCM